MVWIYRLEPFFKSPGELSSGCYANLLPQGHVTETEEILRARYVDHDTHLYVDPPSSSFLLLSHPSPRYVSASMRQFQPTELQVCS